MADRIKQKMPLAGVIAPGGTVTVTGVSYTKEQASNPGWTIVF
ncbi:MAG TPA: hypothetical protein VJ885_16110 [Thermoanaerobaculia bacterium]|nr:hypothetical protein [Thermoanaerobaculia bacterium]